MRFVPRRLYSRIVLLVSLVITGTVVGYGWVMSSREAALLGATLRAEAATTTEYLAATSAHHMVVGDYAALEEFAEWITRLPRILRIEFHDPGGAGLVGASSEPGSPSSHVLEHIPPLTPPVERSAMAEAETGRQITIWRPVSAATLLGWIRITYDLSEIDRMVSDIWRQSILLGLWCVLGGSAIFLVLLRPPMVAIQRLSAFARDLNTAKGKQVEVSHHSAEVDQLAASLRRLARTALHRAGAACRARAARGHAAQHRRGRGRHRHHRGGHPDERRRGAADRLDDGGSAGTAGRAGLPVRPGFA